MLRIVILVTLAFLSLACANAAQIYKCVGKDGKIVFQDSQCGQVVEVIEYTHPESPLEKIKREHREAAEARERRAEEMRARQEVMGRERLERERERATFCTDREMQKGLEIGMSKSQLYSHELWQFPDDISKTTTQNGVTEYLIYKCEGYKTIRLFVTNNRLRSIHN